MRIIKILLVNLFVALLLIILFDVVGYWFLPDRYALHFKGYRVPSLPEAARVFTRQKDYFVKDEKKGFDIGKNKHTYHWIEDGVIYPIWSNSLSCFDEDYAGSQPYIYFAGDSFTWGYTPFEEKFGTIIERSTGMRILKCGVDHTGQQHQYDKFLEIVSRLKILPKAIFVFYYTNDIEDDYAYPQGTVIDGWLVDKVILDKENNLVRRSDAELTKRVRQKLKSISYRDSAKQDTWLREIKRFLKRYSLSAQIVKSSIDKTYASADRAAQKKTRRGNSLSEHHQRLWFLDNPAASKNKAAILRFKQFATANEIPLVFVLIPRHSSFSDVHYYEELRNFLAANAITFTDLTFQFRANHYAEDDLYWKVNIHFNPSGNEIVAKILMKEFPDVFSKP
jgi:hypothetical protein